MATEDPRYSRLDYTVGWICAVPKELEAAQKMLDEIHGHATDVPDNDTNTYELGNIGDHKVAITCLESYGTVNASTAASAMSSTFPNLGFGLMVGIGGGVPLPNDIRLGDIVVSLPTGTGGGVIQYDLGAYEEDGFDRKGTLNKPCKPLLKVIPYMRARNELAKEIWEMVEEVFVKLDETEDLDVKWASPGAKNDVLYRSGYLHINAVDERRRKKNNCEACAAAGPSALELRSERKKPYPKIHYGNIASGNSVMKSGKRRDDVAEKEDVICFEMEAAGLMDDFPCLVIRGICDYADSHKNKNWQPYAAAVAAAYAKKLLQRIDPKVVRQMERIKKNCHWMVDRIVNPHFTGREAILKILREKLCEGSEHDIVPRQRRFVIYGMGGAGKSEVCLKFANDNREKFWGVFWIDASSEASIKSGIAAAGKMASGSDMGFSASRTWFQNCAESWLMILDNADDTQLDCSRYIPTGNNGCILLTSRNPESRVYSPEACEGFERLGLKDAVSLLFKCCNIKNKEEQNAHSEDARAIVKVLAEHALAITQAGAFISKGLSTLKEYPTEYQRQRQQLLERHYNNQVSSIYGSVYATFEVSARAMKESSREERKGAQESRDALDLLNILAYLHRDNVPEEMFTRAWHKSQTLSNRGQSDIAHFSSWHISQLPPLMRTTKLDRIRLRSARNMLHSFSLVAITTEGSISMHPLAHAWARDRLESRDQDKAWATTSSLLHLSIDIFDYDPFHDKLRAHVETCYRLRSENWFQKYPASAFEICQIFYRFAWLFYLVSNDVIAHEIATLLLARVGHEIVPQSKNWRHISFLLALCEDNLGNFNEEIRLLQEVARFDTENPSVHQNDRMSALHALATAYQVTGQNQKALKLLKEVVQIRQKTLSPTHRDLLSSQHELGLAYRGNGQHQKAVKLLKEVVQIEQKTLSPTHPDLLASQHALGLAYRENGQVQKAVKLLKEAVQIRQKTLSPTHPKLLASQHELGRAYLRNGQVQKAVKLLKQVVKIKKTTLAPGNPSRVRSENALAYFISELETQEHDNDDSGSIEFSDSSSITYSDASSLVISEASSEFVMSDLEPDSGENEDEDELEH